MNEALEKINDRYRIKTNQFGQKFIYIRGGFLNINVLLGQHKHVVSLFNTKLLKNASLS